MSAQEALASPLKHQWHAAMCREKQCHEKNQTFGRESKDVKQPVPVGWVFKIKYRGPPVNVNELQPKQFKARVVIRGQYMKEGLHFNDTFAPVAKQTSVRMLIAYATKYGCKLSTGDVETAFLTAKMDCEVYVKLPPFWGPDGEPILHKENVVSTSRLLNKGIPGIPQGSRLFYETFRDHLISLGYRPSASDCCLFFNADLKEKHALAIWVDDFVFAYEQESTYDVLLEGLRRKFNITAGVCSTFLGMKIQMTPSTKTTSLSQRTSIELLLSRAGMMECNPVSTPCIQGTVLRKAAESEEPVDAHQYRSLVALANYIACWTRPDITYIVNKLCKYMSKPVHAHWFD